MTILQAPLTELSQLSENLQTIRHRWHANYPGSGSWYDAPWNWKQLSSAFAQAAYHCGQLTIYLQSDDRSKATTLEISRSLERVEGGLKDMGEAYEKLKFEDFPNLRATDRENIERYAVDFIDLISEFMIKYRKICGLSIQNDKQLAGKSVEERLSRLEEFAVKNGGQGVADFARRLFPELHRQPSVFQNAPIEMPVTAPELWMGARGNPESPVDFIKRIYRPWLGSGLNRAHIRDLDPQLSTALDNWLRKNEMPADLDLPTLSEAARRRLADLQADPEKPTTMTLADARRIVELERKITYRERT